MDRIQQIKELMIERAHLWQQTETEEILNRLDEIYDQLAELRA